MKYMSQLWYARPDDVVGGWAVMNADVPPSEISRADDIWQVGHWLSEEAAEHVAWLHNAYLQGL